MLGGLVGEFRSRVRGEELSLRRPELDRDCLMLPSGVKAANLGLKRFEIIITDTKLGTIE